MVCQHRYVELWNRGEKVDAEAALLVAGIELEETGRCEELHTYKAVRVSHTRSLQMRVTARENQLKKAREERDEQIRFLAEDCGRTAYGIAQELGISHQAVAKILSK